MYAHRDQLRQNIRRAYLADEAESMATCLEVLNLDVSTRQSITAEAAALVREIRTAAKPGVMESFLAQYGLSTQEGVALMCLAEAMLRVPDQETMDALIHDKITPSDWGRHLGQSSSSLVNASTWALMLTGEVLDSDSEQGLLGAVRGLVRTLGEPVIRVAVGQAMKILGDQFVLGHDIEAALDRASNLESTGYTYSYDMLGEAACTTSDAQRYYEAYSTAIDEIARHAPHTDLRRNPGISVKLSALYPRYEYGRRETAVAVLAERVGALALRAKVAAIGLNIDAEEADRLDISLDIVEQVLSRAELAGWDGLGVVVQAYGPRSLHVLEWLDEMITRLDRRIMVRLVKGAYWDAEIKRAQTLGLAGFPVYTRKCNTDISYLAGARQLLAKSERIYPQFATHNAHTAAAVLHMAKEMQVAGDRFEFQRLHGMGEGLHEELFENYGTACRIYAPVGAHEDLLAYLVRRLLENGANSSFVNRIVDERISPEQVGRDPIAVLAKRQAGSGGVANPAIAMPAEIYAPQRRAARGWDITDPDTVAELEQARGRHRDTQWQAEPMLAEPITQDGLKSNQIINPAIPADVVGGVINASLEQVEQAVTSAQTAFAQWTAKPVDERAAMLERLADLYETHAAELFALLTREAGKTLLDGVSEVREAVDFCRYYAVQARELDQQQTAQGRGVFVCISPWNFPLAIFTGQIAAALVTGNTVVAKPAEQTPLIAARAVELMHEAGVPMDVIQLLPGDGAVVGNGLVSQANIAGVCFTGSTETAQRIHRAIAEHAPPEIPLIAETGGINAMIVDSTALPEQAVRDIVTSAFQSAGQRCSALRVLYIQEDVAERTLEMLGGAMQMLSIGDPWLLATDVGPLIDRRAKQAIESYCAVMEQQGRLLTKLTAPSTGLFVPPAVFRISGIEQLEREIFGPVLHVVKFAANELPRVIDDINARGYGLTLGLHTRVDERVQDIVAGARTGNLYVNRNQIGAVVGSQPFGGEGLSGTGPKAGGPLYLRRFRQFDVEVSVADQVPVSVAVARESELQKALDGIDSRDWALRDDRLSVLTRAIRAIDDPLGIVKTEVCVALDGALEPLELPGPTGESNRLWFYPRGTVLCLGESEEGAGLVALKQVIPALMLGNGVCIVAPDASALIAPLQHEGVPVVAVDGVIDSGCLRTLNGVSAVAASGDTEKMRGLRKVLAEREGEILALISGSEDPGVFLLERTVCVDTTAAGGNATLLAGGDVDQLLGGSHEGM